MYRQQCSSASSTMQTDKRGLHIKWVHQAGKDPFGELPSVKLYALQALSKVHRRCVQWHTQALARKLCRRSKLFALPVECNSCGQGYQTQKYFQGHSISGGKINCPGVKALLHLSHCISNCGHCTVISNVNQAVVCSYTVQPRPLPD